MGGLCKNTLLQKKTLSWKRVALRLPGRCFSKLFWSLLGDNEWEMEVSRTPCFFCFLGVPKSGGGATRGMGVMGGVVPLIDLNELN